MKLGGVIGQDRAISVLRESVARGRLHHALLFCGPEGVGKRTTALALAAWLLCEKRGEDACGECAACAQVAAEAHPDLVVERRRDTSDEDQKRDILIEQVHDVRHALIRQALGGGTKIAVVDGADALNHDAQNAFLKMLEEPPPGSVIILVAHRVSSLLPTVRSRCQRISFAPIARETLESLLRDRHGFSAEDAFLLAAYADGSPGAALATDVAKLRTFRDQLSTFLEEVRRGYVPVTRAAQAITSQIGKSGRQKPTSREKHEPFRLPLLVAILRDDLRRAAGLTAADPERPPAAASLEMALRAAGYAYAATVDLGRNAHATLTLERMWLRIGESLAS